MSAYRCFHCETVVPESENHNCVMTQPSDRARKAAAEDAAIQYWQFGHMAEHGADIPHRLIEAFATFERETPGFAAGVEADGAFCASVVEALKGDHNDLRKEAIILAAHRKYRNLTPAPPANEGLDAEALVERVARAINGPHMPVPTGCKFTLEDLRLVRWVQTGDQLKAMRLTEARAALSTIRPTLDAERAKWQGEVADWLDSRSVAEIPQVIRSGAYRSETNAE